MLPRPPRSTLFPYTTPFPSLASRHLELEVVLPLGLGYAPRSNALLDAMKGLGVRDAVLLEAGLLVKREGDRKRTRLNSRHSQNSYAVFCLEKKKTAVDQ